MTKKHFEAIAADIRSEIARFEGDFTALKAIADLTGLLCDTFKACNPLFDRRRFLDACGLGN